MNKITTGALLDNRVEEEKLKDFLHEELASGVDDYKWEERPIKDKYYFPYDQSISLSCVAGGIAITREHFAKKRGIEFIPSRKDIYIRRMNYPSGGMALYDAFNIGIKGMCSEGLVKSQGLSETPMNTQYELTNDILRDRAKNAFDSWVSINNIHNIDSLAKIIQHTPIVSVWFFDSVQDNEEWWRHQPQVVNTKLNLYGEKTARHQVAFVDAVLVGGKKFLIVQDTAGVGTGFGADKNLRMISEEMLKARLYGAGYGINKETQVVPQKPKYNFTRALKVGMSGDDVRALQEVLKYEGCIDLPVTTKLFGGITLAGVKKFQSKHKEQILVPAGLKRPTGYVGSNTLKYLNEHYS